VNSTGMNETLNDGNTVTGRSSLHGDLSSQSTMLPLEIEELSSEMDYMNYYSRFLDSMKETIAETIMPQIPHNISQQFFMALRQEMNAHSLVKEAKIALENAEKSSDNKVEKLKSILEEMEFLLEQANEAALVTGSHVLELVNEHLDRLGQKCTETLSEPMKSWNSSLFRCTILSQANPKNLAAYAALGREQMERIHNLLKNLALMKMILLNDGPRQDKYLPMLDIYHDILIASPRAKDGIIVNDIFHRLALAVALEHAVPINVFDTNDAINPISRYLHYANAYQKGELDPAFSTLTVWELRMVGNNNASNDEIQWCRDMLRNYRPDHITERPQKWKYCMIVKSDVRYKRPEWTPGCPRTYKQMLSGGGMCGPRAWFGRFACKSFGIPTWGVR